MSKRVIWKWPVPIQGVVTLNVPRGTAFLSVAEQCGDVCVWGLVYPDARMGCRILRVFGTGDAHPEEVFAGLRFLGTCVTAGGTLVWHVYEETN